MTALKTFQFTLKGFDGSTSDTDHLIKWVGAETQAEAKSYAASAGWDFETVEEIPKGGPTTFQAGFDVILIRGQKPALPPDKDAPPAKNPNTNCLEGMKCPECGSFGPFAIAAMVIVEVHDDGSHEYGSNEWEDDSCCSCVDCSHVGTVGTFTEGTGS